MAKKNFIAIDPGCTESAFVVFEDGRLEDFGKLPNQAMRTKIEFLEGNIKSFVIEMVASYGMPVGESVFETVFWIGRFWEIALLSKMGTLKIYRKEVKMHLCNSMRAKDSNIRQALIDKYPASGGGKLPQVGTKKDPGPLYGVSKDVWAALGVAHTYMEA